MTVLIHMFNNSYLPPLLNHVLLKVVAYALSLGPCKAEIKAGGYIDEV